MSCRPTYGASAVLLCVALAGCGATTPVSNVPSGLTGASASAAKAVTNFVADAGKGTGVGQTICGSFLAPALVAALNAQGGCARAIDDQAGEISPGESTVTVGSVSLNGKSATVRISSTFDGRSKISTVTLTQVTGGAWRLAGID